MKPRRGDGFADLIADPETLDPCRAWLVEVRRTAPHDMQVAVLRLMREAARLWREGER